MTGGLARALRAVLRYALALLLSATAAGKLLDAGGFAGILRGYRALPEWAVTPAAVAVPAAELLLAIWLISGRHLARAAAAAALLHLIYGAWSAAALARGLAIPNCGCFGVFLARPLTWVTVLEDGVLVSLSLALRALAGRPS